MNFYEKHAHKKIVIDSAFYNFTPIWLSNNAYGACY